MNNIPHDKRGPPNAIAPPSRHTSNKGGRGHGPPPDPTNRDAAGPSNSRIRVRDMRKTSRRLATPHQLSILETALERSRTLTNFTQAEKDELSERTNMTPRQVGHWFQNRRRALARRDREVEDMQENNLQLHSHSDSDSSRPPQEWTSIPDYGMDMTRSSSVRGQISPLPSSSSSRVPLPPDLGSSSMSSSKRTGSKSHCGRQDTISSSSLHGQKMPPALFSAPLTSMRPDMVLSTPNEPSTSWPRDPRFGPDLTLPLQLDGRMSLPSSSAAPNPAYRRFAARAQVPWDSEGPQSQQRPSAPILSDSHVYQPGIFETQTDSSNNKRLFTSGVGVEMGLGLGSHPSRKASGMGLGMSLSTWRERGFGSVRGQTTVSGGMHDGIGGGIGFFSNADSSYYLTHSCSNEDDDPGEGEDEWVLPFR